MNFPTFATIAALLPVYRYALIFFLVIIEGPLVTMLVGFLTVLGLFNPFFAYATIIGAEIVSDSLYYMFGLWGGKKLAEKFTIFTKLSERRLEFFKKLFQKHPRKILILGKLTHVAGVPILISAGINKVRWSIFLIYDFLATLPKSFIFLAIGYYLGKASEQINLYLTYSTLIISSLIVLIFIGYLLAGIYIEKKIIN